MNYIIDFKVKAFFVDRLIISIGRDNISLVPQKNLKGLGLKL